MKITIPPAQGELIQGFRQEMQMLAMNHNMMNAVDKRTTDALIKTAGFDPAKFTPECKLVRDGDAYLLELTEAPGMGPAASDPAAAIPAEPAPARVNGRTN